MLDAHIILGPTWGIKPVLGSVFGLQVEAYPFFLSVGLLIAGGIYYLEAKKHCTDNEHTFLIALAAIIGGTIGAKIPHWLLHYRIIIATFPDTSLFLSGRTIVAGFIGGMVGVWLTKKYLHIQGKRGNLFAPAVAIGMAIGRLGCFFRGCCFGDETHLPIGIDFGDGIYRHPTQLYEAFFWFVLFFVILKVKNKVTTPGLLLKLEITIYFIFRFILDFIKYEPDMIGVLTIYQVTIIVSLLFMYRNILINAKLNYGH